MPHISLTFFFNDDLALKSVVFTDNDTQLDSDSKLLYQIAKTLIKAIALNQDSVIVQDLLNELNIKTVR